MSRLILLDPDGPAMQVLPPINVTSTKTAAAWKGDTLKQPCLSQFLYGKVDRRAGSIGATWKVSILSSNPFRSAIDLDSQPLISVNYRQNP
jgi:hypothetical protein